MKRMRSMAGMVGCWAVAAIILGLPAAPVGLAQTTVASQTESDERIEALEYQLEAERAARQSVEKALAERTKLTNEQKVRIDQVEGTTSSLTKVMRALQTQTAELEKELGAAQQARDIAAKTVTALEAKLEELDYQFQAQASARAAAEKALAEMTKLANEQKVRIDQFEGAAGALTKGMRELQARIAELERELGAAQNARTATEQNFAERSVQLAGLQAKLAALPTAVVEFGPLRKAALDKVRAGIAGRGDAALEGDAILLKQDNLFEPASATLAPAMAAKLADLGKLLLEATADLPDDGPWVLRVEGHTDAQRPGRNSPYKTNLELSAARSIAVTAALTAGGFPAGHLAAVGYGASRPIAQGVDAEANRRNRRVELSLAER